MMSIRAAIFAIALMSSPALAQTPKVATDITPVQSLVARVMQGVGAPGQVVRPGASPHGYAMRPSEAAQLEQADAVFWIGPDLTPWLDRAIANLAPGATVITLSDLPETQLLAFRDGALFTENEGEEHSHGDTHDHSDHDPHVWLDPENAQIWLSVIADTLSETDPENASLYASNAAEGRREIAATQAEIADILAPIKGLRFAVFHDAYHYFENRFGLPAVAAIAAGDAADPGPARVQKVRQVIQDTDVACVFSEPEFNTSFVDTVIEGTGAKKGQIDPLGNGIESGPDFYPALLRSVAQAIAECGK